MKLFKTLLTLAAVAAVVPYKATSTPSSDEEDAARNLSVESLTYRIDIQRNEDGASEMKITVPADGIKRVFTFVRGSVPAVKEKAVALKDKALECKDRVTSRFQQNGEDVPREEITVELASSAEEPNT